MNYPVTKDGWVLRSPYKNPNVFHAPCAKKRKGFLLSTF